MINVSEKSEGQLSTSLSSLNTSQVWTILFPLSEPGRCVPEGTGHGPHSQKVSPARLPPSWDLPSPSGSSPAALQPYQRPPSPGAGSAPSPLHSASRWSGSVWRRSSRSPRLPLPQSAAKFVPLLIKHVPKKLSATIDYKRHTHLDVADNISKFFLCVFQFLLRLQRGFLQLFLRRKKNPTKDEYHTGCSLRRRGQIALPHLTFKIETFDYTVKRIGFHLRGRGLFGPAVSIWCPNITAAVRPGSHSWLNIWNERHALSSGTRELTCLSVLLAVHAGY